MKKSHPKTNLTLNQLLYESRKKKWGAIEKFIVAKIIKSIIRQGKITLIFGKNDRIIINSGKIGKSIKMHPPSLMTFIKIFLNPELQGLDSYVKGEWSPVNCSLIDVIAMLTHADTSYLAKWRRVMEKIPSLSFLFKHYIAPIKSSRKTLLHYNVTADFYEKLLHPVNIYSCAFFETEKSSLKQAQANKVRTIADRAGIPKTTPAKVLDIGCGWGTTAIDLAETHPKAKIDGISIAEAQIDYANNKVQTDYPKLSKRVNFHLCDYRHYLPAKDNIYDAIVSVGMLEHVGKRGYKDYFSHIYRLLKPGAKAAIHSIIRREPGRTNRWIDKYVFPGGYIPVASEVMAGIDNSGLRNLNCYVHEGANYYKTLECWKQNLMKNYDNMLPLLRQKTTHESYQHSHDDYVNFRRWYAYLSGSQSFFLPQLEDGAVCHFIVQKPLS